MNAAGKFHEQSSAIACNKFDTIFLYTLKSVMCAMCTSVCWLSAKIGYVNVKSILKVSRNNCKCTPNGRYFFFFLQTHKVVLSPRQSQ